MRFIASLFLLSGFPGLVFAQSGFDPTALDRSANPCVNFYQYACGTWMASNPVPGDHSRWGRFDALQERNRTILQNILDDRVREFARPQRDRPEDRRLTTRRAWMRRPSTRAASRRSSRISIESAACAIKPR